MTTQIRSLPAANRSVATDLGTHAERILCPVCNRRIFSRNANNIRLKTRILIFEGGNAYSICRHCKHEVIVPVRILNLDDSDTVCIWNDEIDGKVG